MYHQRCAPFVHYKSDTDRCLRLTITSCAHGCVGIDSYGHKSVMCLLLRVVIGVCVCCVVIKAAILDTNSWSKAGGI